MYKMQLCDQFSKLQPRSTVASIAASQNVRSNKYAWVDALRGYAIILVMLIHTSQHFPIRYLKPIALNGDMGVQLFFILSSFTLFSSYQKHALTNDPNLKVNFFIRRLFRIAPYYYIAGLVYVAYYQFVLHQKVSVIKLAINYLFLNGIVLQAINYIPPGGWSVGVEMLFYLCIPFLFSRIKSFNSAIIWLVASTGLSILLHFLIYLVLSRYTNQNWHDVRGWHLYFWLPNQFPVFMLGIVIYFMHDSKQISKQTGTWLLVLSMALFLAGCFMRFSLEYPGNFIQREYVYGLTLAIFTLGTYATNQKWVVNQVVQKIGTVSFSAYLNHFIVIYALSKCYQKLSIFLTEHYGITGIDSRSDLFFLIAFLIVVFVTYLISKYTFTKIELPGIRLGNTIVNQRTVQS